MIISGQCVCGKLAVTVVPEPMCMECARDFYIALLEFSHFTDYELTEMELEIMNREKICKMVRLVNDLRGPDKKALYRESLI